jgi:hypothetical protein
MTSQGRVITLPSAPLPRTGGYRVMAGRRELTRLLDELEPDRIEVSDRATLRWTGGWARQRGVGSMMVSHESLAGLLGVWGMPARDSAGRPAQPPHRRDVRPDRLHDRLRGDRVPPPRRAQPGRGSARRRPGELPPQPGRRRPSAPATHAPTSC